jgi:DNA end-binding protein Ku
MTARAIWNGVLVLGAESVPVKLYSAVEDRSLHFHVLEKSTLKRVRQHMVNAETSDHVPGDKIQKGYKTESGGYVLLTPEELAKTQPKDSRNIEITRFVPAAHIHQQWYDRPYYLAPDDSQEHANAESYFALGEALEHEKSEGIARWVMRKKRYVGALRAEGEYLLLITLKFAEEVLSASELPRPAGRPPDTKEFHMGEQLVATLEEDFRPEDFHDEYRERVMNFIQAKGSGHKPHLQIVSRRKESKLLLSSLAASIKKAKSGREKRFA